MRATEIPVDVELLTALPDEVGGDRSLLVRHDAAHWTKVSDPSGVHRVHPAFRSLPVEVLDNTVAGGLVNEDDEGLVEDEQHVGLDSLIGIPGEARL